MTFFFIILYKYEKKQCFFVYHAVQIVLCVHVCTWYLQSTPVHIYIYINMYVLGTLQYETVSTLS